MTISEQTPRSGPYNGNGSTVAFAYNFLIDDEDELVVVLADINGDETVQTITTHYTVSGVGNNSGGTVTMVTAPASGETLSIRRATTLDQGTDLQNRGAVIPQTLEDTYDELVKMIQDNKEILERMPAIKVTSNTTGVNFPEPLADGLIGWNAGGTDLENKTSNSSAFLSLPSSSVDNALPKFDGTGGNAFQNSGVIVSDNDDVTGIRDLTITRNFVIAGTATGITSLTMSGALATPTSIATSGNITMGGTLTNTAATPIFRLDDSDVNGTVDFRQNGATALIAVDPGNVDASSDLQVNIDGSNVVDIDASQATFGNYTFNINQTVGAGQDGYALVYDDGAGEIGLAAIATVGRNAYWVPAAAMKTRVTNGPAWGSEELVTNDVQIVFWSFDASTEEGVQFEYAMPEGWDEGTITAQFIWSHDGGASFGVVWSIAGVAFADGDALDTAMGTAQTVTDTGGTTDDHYISPMTSAVTIAGSPSAGESVWFEVKRVAANGSDTLDVDARLLGVRLYFTRDSLTD